MNSSTIIRSPNLRDGDVPYIVRLYEAPRPLPFKNGGLARAAQTIRSAGRGGDDVLLHINPEEFEFLKQQWGEPSMNPHTGLPEYGLWSKIKKALKFEVFNTKGILKKIAKNPQRLLTGAIDPLGTKITNKMFGTHYDPAVNQLGGATKQTFQEAKAKGMDTGLAKTLHGVAGAVAGFYGSNALAGLASKGLGAASQALQGSGSLGGTGPISEVVPSVQRIGAGADTVGALSNAEKLAMATNTAGSIAEPISPVVTSVSRVPVTGASQSGLSGLLTKGGKMAGEYAKNPKNWPTILGAVGALGSGGADEGAAPLTPQSPGLQQLPFSRTQTKPNIDWYTYGERPEAAFYSGNTIPAFTPEEQQPKGAKHGGAMSRYVRGPGTGRSDSIDAKLSDGEYVLTAEDVALLGDGSSEAGAKRLDQFRSNLRKHKGGALSRGKISPNAKSPMSYLRGPR